MLEELRVADRELAQVVREKPVDTPPEQEVGPRGVRVNAVAPGLVLTDRLQGVFDAMDPAEQREVLDAIPLRRMPELAEIVEPILFLASPASGYITGVVLDVNGGRFMPL